MRTLKHALVLTKRDLRLLESLGHFGMLCTSQLERKIYPGVQNSTVLRRLRRLERAGWIYRIKALESGELVWLLTRKAEELIRVEAPMIRPNRNGVPHDVQLSSLRMHLESIGLGENFVPDWSVRRQTFDPSRRRREDSQLVPDGIFSATLWDKKPSTVALELEINAKTTQRYERIFDKYLSKSHLRLVWYFVKTEAFAESLIAKWNQIKTRRSWAYRSPGDLIVTVLPQFEANPRHALIHFTDGDTREVEEIFQLSSPVDKSTEIPITPAQPVGRSTEENPESGPIEIAS